VNEIIAWIAAEAEPPKMTTRKRLPSQQAEEDRSANVSTSSPRKPPQPVRLDELPERLTTHQFPARAVSAESVPEQELREAHAETEFDEGDRDAIDLNVTQEQEQRQRSYRARTISMLRRYLRYSIETGRLPSMLGGEFFRAKVSAYPVATFEDRVIFVHDMEKCLARLDEFSQELIARHVLQEHDRSATAKLLHCNEKTVRRVTPMVLDLLAEILLEVGLMQPLAPNREKSCQGGNSGPFSASDCEDGEYKV